MKIDSFCHIMPRGFADRFQSTLKAAGRDFPLWCLDDLSDLERRVAMMDSLGVDKQVVALGALPIDDMLLDRRQAADLVRIANDGIAELTGRFPDRFISVGSITQSDLETGVLEAQRCLTELGMKGIQLHSNARGKPIDRPEYWPFYQMMAQAKAPIWLHPARQIDRPDYVDEETSKYNAAYVFGWSYDTTLAMTRLVMAGLFEQLPDIRIIVHHAGALVPLLSNRLAHGYSAEAMKDHRYKVAASGAERSLPRPVLDYYRMFYTDTVSHASKLAIAGAYEFFGPEHLLFGSDAPFDFVGGGRFTSTHIEAIDALHLPAEHSELIYSGNILRLLAQEDVGAIASAPTQPMIAVQA